MGKKLAEQTVLHQADLAEIGKAAAGQVSAEQDKRLAVEQTLAASDQKHSMELSNEQRKQAVIRDRLANADVRLSVFLDATDSASGSNVHATPAPSAWFMEPREPNLTQRTLRFLNIPYQDDHGLIFSTCALRY